MSGKKHQQKKRWLLLPLLVLILISLDMRFAVRTYTVDLPRMEGSIRLALIADLVDIPVPPHIDQDRCRDTVG